VPSNGACSNVAGTSINKCGILRHLTENL
jgi:hypothetical protein